MGVDAWGPSAAGWEAAPTDVVRTHDVRSTCAEYDFGYGVRGRYTIRFAEGFNVVLLDPDVAAEFRTRKAVNDALRTQLEMKRTCTGDIVSVCSRVTRHTEQRADATTP